MNLDDPRLSPGYVLHLPEHTRDDVDAIATMPVHHIPGRLDEAPTDGLAVLYDPGTHYRHAPGEPSAVRGTLILGVYLGAVITDRFLRMETRWDPDRYDITGHPGMTVEDHGRDDPDRVGEELAERLPTLARVATIASMNGDVVAMRAALRDYDAGAPDAVDALHRHADAPDATGDDVRTLVQQMTDRYSRTLNSLTIQL
ncbi:hypothetical protein FHX42_005270 [Saccharopolyspora lacisalsi]|uniref:Uncharacterized protein n=1 Tax=Halosaccharopolyspora lacisalsi TaxID=1000566 RepID=A0A839E3K3_9PSEU|nr:hypothetical protein [Halosaccharopolyspora lacisalsi]MBA8827863.1 hypothetical protein [Halosaccharopolyspora lacisalsi]